MRTWAAMGRKLRAGDEVVVRSPAEILETLDESGALAGLPFLPEMVPLCGRRLRVARRIEKTCVEGYHKIMRRFRGGDVVMLEGQRCDGSGHDGCSRGCMVFWKEAWLRRAEPGESSAPIEEAAREALRKRLVTMRDATHYVCQSTQLMTATEEFPWKLKPWLVWVMAKEVWYGQRTIAEVVGLCVTWVRRMRVRSVVDPLRGPHERRTPGTALGLRPGDRVRVRPRAEILETLNHNGRNRGLAITHAMTTHCGGEYEVGHRVERMISERTGEIRDVRNTVSLTRPGAPLASCGLECLHWYNLGSCPRGDLLYWREIWLERAGGAAEGPTSR